MRDMANYGPSRVICLSERVFYWSVQIVYVSPFMTGLWPALLCCRRLPLFLALSSLRTWRASRSYSLCPALLRPCLLRSISSIRSAPSIAYDHRILPQPLPLSALCLILLAIVASELWFLYRSVFVEQSLHSGKKQDKTFCEKSGT